MLHNPSELMMFFHVYLSFITALTTLLKKQYGSIYTNSQLALTITISFWSQLLLFSCFFHQEITDFGIKGWPWCGSRPTSGPLGATVLWWPLPGNLRGQAASASTRCPGMHQGCSRGRWWWVEQQRQPGASTTTPGLILPPPSPPLLTLLPPPLLLLLPFSSSFSSTSFSSPFPLFLLLLLLHFSLFFFFLLFFFFYFFFLYSTCSTM